MEEELEQLWQKLQLTEEEEEGVKVTKEVFFEGFPWVPHCLLVSLLTKKSFNKEAFKGTMERAWRSTPLKKITEVGENLFIFQFRSNEDREIIINLGPWNFDDRMVLTKPLEQEDKPRKEILTKTQIWTQIYGLPFAAMTEKMGRLIGMKLGRVIEVKTDEEGLGLGACLAVRVEIDVRKQLLRRLKIAVEDDQVFFVDFKYERLPALCYCCGIIGHNESDCGIAMRKKKEGDSNSNQFGKWIRAPSRQKGLRAKGGSGGRNDEAKQPRPEKVDARKSTGENTDDGDGEADTAEIEKGKMVIASPSTVEPKISVKSHDCLQLSGKASGKGKGILPKANPTLHGNEDEVMLIDEGEGQKGEEEGKPVHTCTGDSSDHILGPGKELGPYEGPGQFFEGGVGQNQSSARGELINPKHSSPKRTVQSLWKRKSREDETMKENKEMGTTGKLGKRGTKETDFETMGVAGSEKRRKIPSEFSNNLLAEPVIQPRQNQ